MDGKSVGMAFLQEPLSWRVYVDAATNQRGFEVGLVMVSPKGIVTEKSLRLGFSTTNNEAGYEALLVRMTMVQKMGGKVVEMFLDSRLVVGQSPPRRITRRDLWKSYRGQITVSQGPHLRILVARYSTPAYPQGNGQAETVNEVIVNGLKKRLDDAKGKWVEELPHVLWTYRTTPCKSTGETPFSFTYGAKAVIPLETRFLTLRTNLFTPDSNDRLLEKGLDLIEERRENSMIQLAYYQQKLKQGYDSNVKLRPLAPGDLVLWKVLGTAKNPAWGKLGPNWEGSYRITSVAGI
ncbi:uncharacterized protein LOC142644037 [Castanea sativa]|uniref:uncharacterized protein LOC142644037 n=1 Tax=Castanea sativa TaxID=21020 RepID=UPI003F64A7A2